MLETMNYILKRIDYLERENRRRTSSMFISAAIGGLVCGLIIKSKNRKIESLEAKVSDLEEKINKKEKRVTEEE